MGIDKRNYGDQYYVQSSATLYRITGTEAENLLSDLCDGTFNNFSITRSVGVNGIDTLLSNSSDYIVNLMYMPLNSSFFEVGGTSTTSIVIGNKTSSYQGNLFTLMKTNVKLFEKSFSRTFNNFLDFAPYTKYELIIPFFPKIDLDPNVVNGHTLYGYVSPDFKNGNITLYLYLDDDYLIDSIDSKIGISIPIGKSNGEEIQRNNVLQSISLLGSAVSIGIGVHTGNPLALTAGVGMATSNVSKLISNNVDHLKSYNGGNGSRSELCVDKHIRLITTKPNNVRYPNYSLRGGVCRNNYTLSSLTGFTQIGDINFDPSGYEIYYDEISEIVELLKSGVIL